MQEEVVVVLVLALTTLVLVVTAVEQVVDTMLPHLLELLILAAVVEEIA
jgi:hypothetical protein